MTALSPPSLFLAPNIVEPGPSAKLAGLPLAGVPGVTHPAWIFRARRRPRRPIWLTAQREVDRDQQIFSCALFWDDGKSIAKSPGIAAYLDPALIPEQWSDGRDHGPVLGRSKLHSEGFDEPGAYVDRTTASPIRSLSPPRSVPSLPPPSHPTPPPRPELRSPAPPSATPRLSHRRRRGRRRRRNPRNLHAPITAVLLSSGVLALVRVSFCPLACSRRCPFVDWRYEVLSQLFPSLPPDLGAVATGLNAEAPQLSAPHLCRQRSSWPVPRCT